jgi:hypothetical protein
LWRTFQDRLVSELRLAQAATLEQANAVLARFREEYNRQFAKAPQQAGSAYRKLDRRLDVDRIFSLRYERMVSNDHVIRERSRWHRLWSRVNDVGPRFLRFAYGRWARRIPFWVWIGRR